VSGHIHNYHNVRIKEAGTQLEVFMNLDLAHAILIATTRQPYGFLKIVNPTLVPEVREMAEAGLIKATISDGKPGSFTAVNSVTEDGLKFLRVFRPHDFAGSPEPKRLNPRVIIPFVSTRIAVF
jgi:hypothetical protein